MFEVEKAKKKFDKIFKTTPRWVRTKSGNTEKEGGKVLFDTRKNTAISSDRTIAMSGKKLKEIIYPEEITYYKMKLPTFRQAKTLAIFDVNLLLDSIQLMKSLGYQDIAVKMISESENPIEFIGMEDSGYNDEPKPRERLMLAPKINESVEFREWIKNETRKIRKAPKKVEKNETPIPIPEQTVDSQ